MSVRSIALQLYTCVCKLLYAVLTNTLSCHSSHTSIQNGCSLTLYGSSGFTAEFSLSILHWLYSYQFCIDLDVLGLNVRWLVLDLKVQKCTDIESMPGFQRPAYCNRTSVRFALCVSQMRLEMETSKAAIKWMELHFDTGGACQVHIGNALVEVFPRRIWYLVRY